MIDDEWVGGWGESACFSWKVSYSGSYLKLSVSLSRFTPGGADDSHHDSDHHAFAQNDYADDNDDQGESKFGKIWWAVIMLQQKGDALHFTVFPTFEISLNNFPRLFLWAPNPSRECLTGSFCQKHCCKPFNVTQLGFCCTFKKQNNPYIGLQVELGLRSTCFAKRFKAGLRHGIKNDPSKDQLRGWRWGRNGQRALRSAWFEELTCFAVSKAGAAAARWFYSTSTCSSRQQWWCNSHQPNYFNPIIFPPQSQYLSATRRHNLVQLQ